MCLNSANKLAKERWMCHVNSNSKTLKLQRRDIISDSEFLLSILNASFRMSLCQDVIKRDICWYRKNWPKALTHTFTATRYLNRNKYFYCCKTRKDKYGSCSNLYNYFLHFNFLSRDIKNQTGTMIYFHRFSILL